MIPSVKTLEAAFPGHGKDLRKILEGVAIPKGVDKLGKLTLTADWVRTCYHRPTQIEINMHAASELTGMHGTEALFGAQVKWPDMEYVNSGDTYTTTLIYDYLRGRYLVMSYGDWVEREERKGRTYV